MTRIEAYRDATAALEAAGLGAKNNGREEQRAMRGPGPRLNTLVAYRLTFVLSLR
jgi:hypothetical protein